MNICTAMEHAINGHLSKSPSNAREWKIWPKRIMKYGNVCNMSCVFVYLMLMLMCVCVGWLVRVCETKVISSVKKESKHLMDMRE